MKVFWPHRLTVRTSPFHGENTGSNPVGVTNYAIFYSLKNMFLQKLFLNLLSLKFKTIFILYVKKVYLE